MSKRIVIGCDGDNCGSISDGYLNDGFGADLVAPGWSVIKLHQPQQHTFGTGLEMTHAGTYHYCRTCLPKQFHAEESEADQSP